MQFCCVSAAVNRRMDEWVRLENLDLNTVDVADAEGADGKGCGYRPKSGSTKLPNACVTILHLLAAVLPRFHWACTADGAWVVCRDQENVMHAASLWYRDCLRMCCGRQKTT